MQSVHTKTVDTQQQQSSVPRREEEIRRLPQVPSQPPFKYATPPTPERTARRVGSRAALNQSRPLVQQATSHPVAQAQPPSQVTPVHPQVRAPTGHTQAATPQPVRRTQKNHPSDNEVDPVTQPAPDPTKNIQREQEENRLAAALPLPNPLKRSTLGDKLTFQQRLANVLRRPDLDEFTNISVRGHGDEVPKNTTDAGLVAALNLSGLKTMFPSVPMLSDIFVGRLKARNFAEGRDFVRHLIGQITEACEALEELPTGVLELPSFQGKRMAVELSAAIFSRTYDALVTGAEVRPISESQVQKAIAPSLTGLKMLTTALDVHIHGAATELRHFSKNTKRTPETPHGDKYKRYITQDHDRFLSTLTKILGAVSEDALQSAINPKHEAHIQAEIANVHKVFETLGAESAFEIVLSEKTRRVTLGKLLVRSNKAKIKRAKSVKEHLDRSNDPSYIAGITISPKFAHSRSASTSTVASTATTATITTLGTVVEANSSRESFKSTKSALRPFQRSPKETPRNVDESGEYLYAVRNSTLFIDDPLNRGAKVPMPAPMGDAALIKMDGQNPGRVKAISIPAIVHQLTSPDPDKVIPELEATFMNTFRLISDAVEFFQLLVDRYNENSPELLTFSHLVAWATELARIRNRVYDLLEQWFRDFWHHDEDCIIGRPFIEFIKLCVETHGMRYNRALSLVNTLCVAEILGPKYVPKSGSQQRRVEVTLASQNLKPCSPTHFQFSGHFSFSSCVGSRGGITELARQITLVASDLYRNFETTEFVKYWVESASKTPDAVPPSGSAAILQKAVAQDSYLCYTVQIDILKQPTPAKRAERLVFWIDVAEQCIAMRNFWGACAITNACGNSYVRSLRETVSLVPVESRTKWHYISDIFDSRCNYKEYRRLIGEKLAPTIPWLAVLVHDVVHARERIKMNKRSDGLPEIEKLKMMYSTVNAMESCRIPYNYPKHQAIREFLLEQYGYLMRLGPKPLKSADDMVKRLSDNCAVVDNARITKRGGWEEGVPDQHTRANLHTIFNHTEPRAS